MAVWQHAALLPPHISKWHQSAHFPGAAQEWLRDGLKKIIMQNLERHCNNATVNTTAVLQRRKRNGEGGDLAIQTALCCIHLNVHIYKWE